MSNSDCHVLQSCKCVIVRCLFLTKSISLSRFLQCLTSKSQQGIEKPLAPQKSVSAENFLHSKIIFVQDSFFWKLFKRTISSNIERNLQNFVSRFQQKRFLCLSQNCFSEMSLTNSSRSSKGQKFGCTSLKLFFWAWNILSRFDGVFTFGQTLRNLSTGF